MNSFFKSVRSSKGGRDVILKDSLISKLSSCVKDLQIEEADPNSSSSSEAVSALCTVLEAIFIHGLKESFLRKVSQVVLSEIDARPDPDFWGPLLVVSHRDVIAQIIQLHLVQTDVGRCRVWLRLALNEGLLSSYLKAIRKEGQRALRGEALLRDAELLDVAQHLLEGVEGISFSLPLNSSVLDTWTVQPLLLAGLWAPPMRAASSRDAVAVATDAAQILERENCDPLPTDTIASLASYHSATLSPMQKWNEEEALMKITLGTPVNIAPISTLQCSGAGSKESQTIPSELKVESNHSQSDNHSHEPSKHMTHETLGSEHKNRETVSAVGNSLVGRLGWSSSFDESRSDPLGNTVEETSEKELKTRKTSLSRSSTMLQSYHSLLESYNTASVSGAAPPDLEDFLRQFESKSSCSSCSSGSLPDPIDMSYPEEPDFEVIETPACYTPAFGHFLVQFTKLPLDLGLDAQKYSCFGCSQPIGFNFGAARLCSFSGRYFCNRCSVTPGEEWVIPARIIYNWDFQRFSVSKKSATFLNEIQHHPLLDLKVLNPLLYLVVDEMAELQKLRVKLNLLRAYLFTCREPIIEDLRKKVWPREYLYEHIHLYSLSDLLEVQMGTLTEALKHIVAFAQKHVYGCWLCSQKGFFCEKCENPNIIYPFDTDSTYRCPGCNAVFHETCLNSNLPCPKCKRQKERELVSSSEAVTFQT